MSQIPDALAALRGILKADATIASLLSQRVFNEELPAAESGSMPREAIVLKLAGGGTGIGSRGYVPIGTIRVDVFCYGGTPSGARRLWRAVHPVFKSIKRKSQDGVLIHSCLQSGGPISLRDGDTEWPLVFESWQVIAAEVTAA